MTGQAPSYHTPSAERIDTLARAVLRSLPHPFAEFLGDIVLTVEEFADPEALAAVGLRDKWELVGLYQGVPVGDKSAWALRAETDRIRLFRQPLLAEWRATGVTLESLVRHVVVHEVGHHFGLSDDDMHALEDEDE